MTLPFPHVVADTEADAVEAARALNGLSDSVGVSVKRVPLCYGVWVVMQNGELGSSE